jgi:mRNA-degrading endonuclease RelE of RelBE toxin-antitoxin system
MRFKSPIIKFEEKVERLICNVTKLQGREGYRLRVSNWRVLYELQGDRSIVLVLDMGQRGGIYK